MLKIKLKAGMLVLSYIKHRGFDFFNWAVLRQLQVNTDNWKEDEVRWWDYSDAVDIDIQSI